MKETQRIELKGGFNEEVIEMLVAMPRADECLSEVDDDGNPTEKLQSASKR